MKKPVTYRKQELTHLSGVKIYVGALAEANRKGFKASFLFFLFIKQITKSSTIHNYEKVLVEQTGFKKTKIYSEVSKLKKAGLLKVDTNRLGEKYISLSSIASLYRYLDFQVSNCFDENERQRQENNHIPMSRLPYCQSIKELEAAIEFFEIKRNLYKQEITIKNKFVQGLLSKKLGTDYKNIFSDNIIRRERKLAIHRFYRFNKTQRHQLNSTALPNRLINFDVTISTKKTADLFGYKSARSGTNIQRQLKERGLIKVERRDELIEENVDYTYFLECVFPVDCYFINNTIRRRHPNKITLRR